LASKASKPIPPRPLPRLYLATPPVEHPQALLEQLPSVLTQADVAAVLLRLTPAEPGMLISRIKTLAPAIQGSGVALLLDGHAELVARAGADGAHLSGIAAFEQALPALKPERIAGAGGLTSRHDAMTAGELGADYVLFGEPDGRGQRPSVAAICERLKWWDELFEVPSVGFAGELSEVVAFAAAGADFVLLGDWAWKTGEGLAAALRAAEAAMRQARATAPAKAQAPQD